MSATESVKPLRTVLVGCGHRGMDIVHAVHQHLDDRIQFTSICTQSNGLDWHRTLAAPGVEACIIATPPSVHGSILLECIERGIPAFVEPPLTLALWEAEHLGHTSARIAPSLPILVDHSALFSAAWRHFVALLPTFIEAHGRPIKIEVNHFNRGPYRDFSPLYAFGSHAMAMLLDAFGTVAPWTVKKADVLSTCDRNTRQCGELWQVEIDFDGIPVRMSLGNGAKRKGSTFTVTTLRSVVAYDGLAQTVTTHLSTEWKPSEAPTLRPAILTHHPDQPLVKALTEWATAIHQRTPITALRSLPAAVDGIRLLDAVARTWFSDDRAKTL